MYVPFLSKIGLKLNPLHLHYPPPTTQTHTHTHARALPASRDVVTARRPIGGAGGAAAVLPPGGGVTGGGAVGERDVARGCRGCVGRLGLHVRRAGWAAGFAGTTPAGPGERRLRERLWRRAEVWRCGDAGPVTVLT